MSAIDLVSARLKTEEGFRATKYLDTTGHATIGYGFNVDGGISRAAAAALLTEQVIELDAALEAYAWYAPLDDVRRSVVLDIAFNQGLAGLLHYPHMIAALAVQNWAEASAQCVVADPGLNASRYAPLRVLLLSGGNS